MSSDGSDSNKFSVTHQPNCCVIVCNGLHMTIQLVINVSTIKVCTAVLWIQLD